MKIIGLTGGIGSGKSVAARFLTEAGAEVIDLDKAGHDALKKGSAAYKKAVKEFGEGILSKDGEIDRARLGEIVFNDLKALNRLNEIVHPIIDKTVARTIKECRRRGVKVVALEAAALLEADKTWQVDEIWVTTANEKTVLERLKARSGYSMEETKKRIRSQMTNEERFGRANVVIANDSTLFELRKRVRAEWEKLMKRL